MHVLWIDTSTCGCNIAVGDENNVWAYECNENTRGQSEHLLVMIDRVLKKAQLKLSDIERISICKGPGSFTGVRIGLAVGLMFSRVLNVPCIGISAFELSLLAIDAPQDIPYAIAIHSFRDEPFLQVFKNEFPITKPFVATKDSIQQYKIEEIFMYESINFFNFSDINKKIINLYQSEMFFKNALSLSCNIDNIEKFPALPLYIRAADAQIGRHNIKKVTL
ncbi:MAG: tRNA (adenosine(37)-N6)-threonylcarbamoyltransferase complex dimerization subunit type 1 TsaB [Alphaproteobacteria bacterium]